MKTFLKNLLAVPALLALFTLLNLPSATAYAQGTAFTYQGQLLDNGQPANGTYDLTFMAFPASTGGSADGTLTNTGVAVSNGLFTTTLDFHGVPDGSLIWLELGVRTNGGGSFTTVSPRQALTPSPYALFANTASNLVGNLPASQLSGTMTAAQLPSDVVTNGGTEVALSGTFGGDGGGLTNVSGTLRWQVVSGTSVQAAPNTGYLLTNDALVTVTLPTTPSPGAIVRVSGSGTSGWRISQNAGQSVRTSNRADSADLVWIPRISGAGRIASSADGTKLLMGANYGQLYTSTDSGVTWSLQASPTAGWSSVASSADGSKLVAGIQFGQIYTSADSGTNWTARAINTNWISVASSADGTKLVAGAYNGQIYTSVDSGTNWTARATSAGWTSVASSADGVKLVALTFAGDIYTSINSGVTWVVSYGNGLNWQSVASSMDGSKLLAGGTSGQLYRSLDAGRTWNVQTGSHASGWISVASSADGLKLVAAAVNQVIYTSSLGSSPGVSGYLLGDESAAMELQYIGHDRFILISREGVIQAY